ncbi:UPF0158 family protein [Saccharopolyspora shandongensis]|uniref:UPF0158 family protein n=1 Tax=Saccharopolyspora shandongensis TaxID=418495 RepID=UPI0033CD0967
MFWTADCGIDGHTPVDVDDLDLVCIAPLPSYVWYQDMADFAETISDEAASRRLARAIQGEGAFRRFKNELHEKYPHLLPAWYAFRDMRAARRAVQWLVNNSLIDHETGERFVTEPQIPTFPEPAAGLRDFPNDESRTCPRTQRRPSRNQVRIPVCMPSHR